MDIPTLHIVTGAFGYSGRYIASKLLADGCRVRTLTNSQRRTDPFGGRVEVQPLNFGAPEQLAASLRGATVLYNTYWVRFNHRNFTHAQAVENTLRLFQAARAAGVRRVVHVSILNPAEDSPFEYFRGKAQLERALRESGLSYAILRPAVLFGGEDILVNNICWGLRRFPVYGVFGNGQYRLRPIHVEDLAELAVAQGQATENCVIDAVGPESFTYRGLVEELARLLGLRRWVVGVPPALGFLAVSSMGLLLRDKVLTWQEVKGLMAGLLHSDAPPAGRTKLTDWARANAANLGLEYHSELARRR